MTSNQRTVPVRAPAAPASLTCRSTSQRCRGSPQPIQAVLATTSAKDIAINSDKLKKMRLITAVKTPYLPNGKFDLKAYDAILQQQLHHGVEGVIVGGTTGEGQLMSWDEHIMLIAHTVNLFGDRLAVIGNTGSNSTREALHATEQGFAVGMHAALQINPYYGKTSQAGLLTHFNAVLNEGPAIVYNVPGRTGQDIPDVVVHELAQHPNFLGMKECTGNKRIAGYTSRGITCWSGNDDEAHDARHGSGAVGVISVTSNVLPGVMASLMSSPDPQLNSQVQRLISWMFSEPNPIPLNTAMAMCGLCKPVFRLPYVPLSREQREKGAELLNELHEHLPGSQEVRVLEDHDFTLIGRY
ncbi:dihydrodipicolinate synthase [Haematococcus lacustris]